MIVGLLGKDFSMDSIQNVINSHLVKSFKMIGFQVSPF